MSDKRLTQSMSVFHTRIGNGGLISVGNRDVFIREGGEGENLLLLPSAFLSNRSWLRFAPLVHDRMHTIAVDLIGVGRTSRARAPRDLALSAQADMLVHLLDKLEIDRIHVMGSSYGGNVGFAFAGLYPDRVRSLIAIEAPILSTNYEWVYQVRSNLNWLRAGRLAFWGLVKSGIIARSWTSQLLGKRRKTVSGDKKATVFECYFDPYARLGGWTWLTRAPIDDAIRPLSAIKAPILFLQGSDSPLHAQLDRMRDQLLRVQPSLHWQMIPLAEHDMVIQLPALVCDAANNFWNGLPS